MNHASDATTILQPTERSSRRIEPGTVEPADLHQDARAGSRSGAILSDMRTVHLAAIVSLGVLLALGPGAAHCQDAAPVAAVPDAPRVTAERRDAAIRVGFRYLDEKMWTISEGGSPRKQYTIAIAGLASLLAGDRTGKDDAKLPSRKKELALARDYIVRYAADVAALYGSDDKKRTKKKKKRKDAPQRPGPRGGSGGIRGPSQFVWPLGIGGLFLAESVKRGSGKRDAKTGLRDVVIALSGAQQGDGGWGHDDANRSDIGSPPIKVPTPDGGSRMYPDTLLAASNGALVALGVGGSIVSATNDDALSRGREYFRESQNGGGSWPYDPSQSERPSTGTSEPVPEALRVSSARVNHLDVARSGGAVFALLCAGAKSDDPTILRALRVIDAHPEWASEGHGSATLAFQWNALLAKARGPETWAVFRRTYFARILEQQSDDGSYDCACRESSPAVTCDSKPFGDGNLPGMDSWVPEARVYVTAIHTLILLLDRSELASVPAMPGLAAEITPR